MKVGTNFEKDKNPFSIEDDDIDMADEDKDDGEEINIL